MQHASAVKSTQLRQLDAFGRSNIDPGGIGEPWPEILALGFQKPSTPRM